MEKKEDMHSGKKEAPAAKEDKKIEAKEAHAEEKKIEGSESPAPPLEPKPVPQPYVRKVRRPVAKPAPPALAESKPEVKSEPITVLKPQKPPDKGRKCR